MPILGGEAATRRRFAAGTRGTSGRFTPGATIDTAIVAAVQPASGDDLQTLPEGERTMEVWRIYSDTELRAAVQSTGEQADRVIVDAIVYEVRKVWDWGRSIRLIPHHKALAIRLQEPDTVTP